MSNRKEKRYECERSNFYKINSMFNADVSIIKYIDDNKLFIKGIDGIQGLYSNEE